MWKEREIGYIETWSHVFCFSVCHKQLPSWIHIIVSSRYSALIGRPMVSFNKAFWRSRLGVELAHLSELTWWISKLVKFLTDTH